ncbi:MAG: RsmE family RNA methyltransferase [Caldimicrobium sp.]
MLKGGNRFYFAFQGERGVLPEKEAHHLVRVCRKKKGEEILLIDGKGREYLGKIVEINEKGKSLKVEVEILTLHRVETLPPIEIISFIPLLKGDKTEFLIEKGVELGIHKFIIYSSTFTIPSLSPQKLERFKEKALSAMKQSGRLFFPEIELIGDLVTYLRETPLKEGLKLLASPDGKPCILEFLEFTKNPQAKIYLLSGPEGGLSEEEINEALNKGFVKVSLSPYVLRSETAAFALMSLAGELLLYL